uniref:UVR domain-containing protein n=1 Tax=Macrostomum lignano TaxID=282301 RepID=A0A1I8F3E9_9PLAT
MQCISCSPFSIIHCSSQDAGHPATALQSPSPWSTGWLSAKFCLYPQELVLGLEEPLKVRKIQLVSHPHCIASKVEFYIGDCPPDEPRHVNNVRWSRLGHVALLSNQSGKQRRELKSIHLEANGSFVKLSLHSNHSNAERNPYNQVGIIALAIQSQPLDADDDEASKSTLAAAAAAYQSPYVDLGFDLTCHPRLVQLIRELDWEKQQLVAKELLGAAKGVQARISAAVSAGQELAELELDKAKAIAIEDYGLAEDYKIAIQNKLDAALMLLFLNDTAYNEANKEESASELPSVAMDTARTESSLRLALSTESTGGGATDRRNVLALSYDDTPLPTLQNQTVNEEDEQPGSGGRKSATQSTNKMSMARRPPSPTTDATPVLCHLTYWLKRAQLRAQCAPKRYRS